MVFYETLMLLSVSVLCSSMLLFCPCCVMRNLDAMVCSVCIMEDGYTLPSSDDNPSSEENQFVEAEMELFLPNLETSDLQHLQLKGDKLAWKSSLDSLKSFVMCDLQQQGKWTSPGGNMKQFKSNNKNLIINWYSKKQQTLCFQGRDGPTLKERLVQLVQNMHEMTTDTPDSNTLPSTTAVHTESCLVPSRALADFGTRETSTSEVRKGSWEGSSGERAWQIPFSKWRQLIYSKMLKAKNMPLYNNKAPESTPSCSKRTYPLPTHFLC